MTLELVNMSALEKEVKKPILGNMLVLLANIQLLLLIIIITVYTPPSLLMQAHNATYHFYKWYGYFI